MNDRITAQVILRGADGSSILEADESVTAANATRYAVDEGVIRKAVRQLQTYGFKVEKSSPYSVSITGKKTLFEKVFDTKLRPKKQRPSESGGAPGTFYEADDPLEVPEELADHAAAVTLSTPPQLFP